MRARLWPDADVEEMGREAHAIAAGSAAAMLNAAFLAEDDEARPLGFLELLRAEGSTYHPSTYGTGIESHPSEKARN
jgi:hypothetical protein